MAIQNADSLRIPTAGAPVLSEVVRRLVEAYGPEYIYLFGSMARGHAGPDSDFDIMVVVPDAAPREMRACGLAYRALRGSGIAKDILVWTRSEFEKRLHLEASLPSAILREDRVLHAA
jgi:predicted nucleotidyltransferase